MIVKGRHDSISAGNGRQRFSTGCRPADRPDHLRIAGADAVLPGDPARTCAGGGVRAWPAGGGSGSGNDLRLGLCARVFDLRAAVGPLRTQADPRAGDGRAGDCYGGARGRAIAADRGGAPLCAGSCRGKLRGRSPGLHTARPFHARWRATGIGAISTAFLSAGILGQVYAQGVALRLGWRWVFGLAAPAFAIAAIAMAVVLLEPVRDGQSVSLGQRYRELGGLALRRNLALPNAAAFWVLLSFVAMYAALAPILKGQFGLDDTGVLLVRLAGLPAILLAPLAGWLVGRQGAPRVAVVGYLLAAVGLAAEAISVGVLGALVIASVIFVLGVADHRARGDRVDREPRRLISGWSAGSQRRCGFRRSLVRPAGCPAANRVYRPDARARGDARGRGRPGGDQQPLNGRRHCLGIVARATDQSMSRCDRSLEVQE